MATLVSAGSPAGKMSRKPTPTTVKIREESDEVAVATTNTLMVRLLVFHFTVYLFRQHPFTDRDW